VPEAELAEIRELATLMMSTAISLSIPVRVETKSGKNWGELK
jgi:DNA polymerase I-like protein with 3'-5' exonuclease and polymerase domains